MIKDNKFDFKIWALLVFAVALASVLVSSKKLVLCSAYQTTTGIIGEKFPENHSGFNFNYKLNGTNYSGYGYAEQIGSLIQKIQSGDSVTIFYDKNDPSNHTLENPKVLFVRIIGQIVAAIVVIPVAGVFIVRRYNAKKFNAQN